MRADKNAYFTKERRGFESSSLGSRNENRRPAQYGGLFRIGAVVGWALLLFAGIALLADAQAQAPGDAEEKLPEISKEARVLLKEWQQKLETYGQLLEEAYRENPTLRLAAEKLAMFNGPQWEDRLAGVMLRESVSYDDALARDAERYFRGQENAEELRKRYYEIRGLYSVLEIYYIFRSPLHADIFDMLKTQMAQARNPNPKKIFFGFGDDPLIKSIYETHVDQKLLGPFPDEETDEAQAKAVAAWWMKAMEIMEGWIRIEIERRAAEAHLPDYVKLAAREKALEGIPRQLYEFYYKEKLPASLQEMRNELSRQRHEINAKLPPELRGKIWSETLELYAGE